MKAQSSTEYIVIFASILILVVLLSSILGIFPKFGGDSVSRSEKINLAALPVGIENYVLSNESFLLILKNNKNVPIRIHNISLDGVYCDNSNLPIDMGINNVREIGCNNIEGDSVSISYNSNLVITWENLLSNVVINQTVESISGIISN